MVYLSIDGYFQKIESIVSVLNGLGSPLSNDDVVTFALEGLPSTYETISTVIVSQKPFPDLKTVRSLLTTHEMRLMSRVQNPLVDATSASLMVLLAKSNTGARRGPSLEKVNNPCWSFAKGSCWFGDAGKYLHNGVHGKSTLLPRTSGSASSMLDVTRSDFDTLQSLLAKFGLNAPNTSTPSLSVAYTVFVPPGFPRGSVSDGVTAAGGLLSTAGGSDAFWSTARGSPCSWTFIAASQFTTRVQQQQGGSFPSSVHLGQSPNMPFHPSASSHLNDYVHYLNDALNMCIYPSVAVGDGHFILIQITNLDYMPHLPYFWDMLPIILAIVALILTPNKIIISCHVTFDETIFLFPSTKSTTTPSYDFLDDSIDLISIIIRTAPVTPVPAPVHTSQVDVPTPPTPPPPPTPQSVPQILPEHAPAPTNYSPTVSIHPMVTRSHVETTRPNPHYTGHVSTISPLPRSYKEAFNDPNWRNAMFDKYNALIKNKTWTSVPRPEGANIVHYIWLFRHKFLADGTLSRYKARLVANGSTQVEGVDVDETFSLVVKPGTIRTVLSLTISQHWPVHQLDVKNAFLHGDLAETGDDTTFLLLYVDDIVLTASSDRLLQQIVASLHREFSMTNLGALNYFLGISVTRDSSGMFLSYLKYAMDILERAHMVGCNPSRTPGDTESKLGDGGTLVVDPTLYRSLGGYCVFLGNNLLSWSSKHHPTLSRSNAEAEYRGVANVVAETCWIQNLLRELHTPLSFATIVYCDNVSDVYLSSNPIQHQRTKHIEIDIHFVRDLVATRQVRILHVPSRFQYVYIFTKGLPSALFDEFRDSLSVRCTPAPTAGEY
nr:ribonuclease H-like domain-containing protein [Tanacetum cinerariifolium]